MQTENQVTLGSRAMGFTIIIHDSFIHPTLPPEGLSIYQVPPLSEREVSKVTLDRDVESSMASSQLPCFSDSTKETETAFPKISCSGSSQQETGLLLSQNASVRRAGPSRSRIETARALAIAIPRRRLALLYLMIRHLRFLSLLKDSGGSRTGSSRRNEIAHIE